MFGSRKTALTWLLVLVFGVCYSTRLNAQYTQFSSGPGERLRITVATGWGLYGMDDVNKHYIDRFAKEVGILEDNIDGGPGLYGEISYFVTPRISTGLGVIYLNGRSEKRSWENVLVVGEGRFAERWERSLTTTAMAPQVTVKYHFPLRDMDLFSEAGMAWVWGKTVLKSDARIPDLGYSETTEYRFTAQGMGLVGSVGMSHDMTDSFVLGTEIGYRHFVTGDVEDEAGHPWEVEYGGTPHKLSLDFSGAFVLVTLSLKL